jgi:redox-sensitive bicupin YhaK (pirin superfamily)
MTLFREDGCVIEVRRASARFRSDEPGRTTWHSFSFGPHYDPANLSFGALVCHNDDHLQPGAGYAEHPHADVEIVTWVLAGALDHTDDAGRRTTLTPGTVQLQSAGRGIRHSEVADPEAGPTRFVQAWVRPDVTGAEPAYHVAEVGAGAALTEVAGAQSLAIGTAGATLSIARLDVGDTLALPALELGHLFVAGGHVALATELLTTADAARLRQEDRLEVTCLEPAELMLWSFARG